MKIAYFARNRKGIYLNITNKCTNKCVFCLKYFHNEYDFLHIHGRREPSKKEILNSVEKLVLEAGKQGGKIEEICFCGYGEPTCRLDVLLAVARALKGRGAPLRLNTNGLGSLINGRDILPDLAGLLDVISVSLNAANARDYDRLCHSRYGEAAFQGVVSFLRRAKEYIPRVVASVVPVEGVDLEACRQLAAELGVEFRVRQIIPGKES